MKLAVIGLGVMGRNLALNFRDAGHQCVVWDPWPEARDWQADGIEVCDTLEALVNNLPVPSIVLLMIKSGARPMPGIYQKPASPRFRICRNAPRCTMSQTLARLSVGPGLPVLYLRRLVAPQP